MAGISRVLLAMSLVAAAPHVAGAQGLFGPGVEVGMDFGAGMADGDSAERRGTIGPRVTLHLAPRNALVFFGDAASSRVGERSWYRTQLFGAQFRRAIYESGGFTFNGVAGMGAARHEEFTAAFPSVGRDNQPIIIPESHETSTSPMVQFGVNLEQRLAERLSIRGEFLMVGAEDASEYRLQAGFSVPLRPYSSTRTSVSTAYGSTPLRTGQRLWVTSQDGQETSGKISAIDANRIEVATSGGRVSLARSDIRQIAVADGLANGTLIGASIGAASFGAFVSWLNVALCESDSCNSVAPALVGGAYGAAIGGVAGALIDSLIDGRKIVFGSGAVRVNVRPITNGLGAMVVLGR
jgi:hypothetical protein